MRVILAREFLVSVCVLAWMLAFALLASPGYSQTEATVDDNPKVQQRLQEVEAMKKDLLRKMEDLDNRMRALEAEMKRQNNPAKIAAKPAPPPQQPLPPPPTLATANPPAPPQQPPPPTLATANPPAPPQQPPPQTLATANPPANPAIAPEQTSEPANFNFRIFGKATLDAIYNERRPQAPGVPFYLVPTVANGFSQNTMDVNARQSQLGVAFTGPMIGPFQSGGRISAVFFDSTILADRNGFLLQQSYGELFNDHWRFAAGLQLDVFAPGLPTVLPFSGLGGSGSVGNTITGQIRVEHFVPVGSDSQLTLQAAVSEPFSSYNLPDTQLDEDNGWPNVEGRIAFGWGQPAPVGIGLVTQRPLEVGVSGVTGQLRRTAQPPAAPRRVVSDVWGAAVDWRVNLARLSGTNGDFGLKGEAYTGQALGTYNGSILQTLDAVTWQPIRSWGGWVEGFVYWTPGLHSHVGFGFDETNPNDITGIPNTDFGRTYNSTLWSNLIWDVNKAFRLAFEVTYRETRYKEPTNLPNQGWGFHAQFSWAFDRHLFGF